MQFLDHIRRGTSINMMDLAPGPMPNDLAEALRVRRRAPPPLHTTTHKHTRFPPPAAGMRLCWLDA